MAIPALLPDAHALQCEQVRFGPESITLFVASTRPIGECPDCGRPSARVHSRYVRTLADLPWHGVHVQLRWRSRKFFCDTPLCPQRIFTERLPQVALPHARKTQRMAVALTCIGFACGGEGGARLADRLGMPTSPDSLLRAIRRAPLGNGATPRVLGVDDWAYRRGQRYGTILCDLERHCPVELLPERSSEALQGWLMAHPGVEVISRDRGDSYIKGATTGAPRAIQVADRWHLLRNLRQALVRAVDRYPRQVLAAAREAAARLQDGVVEAMPASRLRAPPEPGKLTRCEQLQQFRRARRLERYQQVMALHRQGVSQRAIARRLGMHRKTVARFLHAGSFPERAARRYLRRTDPFVEYLRRRWQEGCHNAVQLTGELKQRGFDGSYNQVRRCVAGWRQEAPPGLSPSPPTAAAPAPVGRPSSNRVAWLMVKPPTKLTPEEEALLTALGTHCPPLRTSADLARQFVEMIEHRQAELLEAWIRQARGPEVPAELRRFAQGIEADLAAVRAALSLPWSNGQTEGQVNRLKLIKRQMYGRAKFDLLQRRFLHTG